jgi:O-antigen ligase
VVPVVSATTARRPGLLFRLACLAAAAAAYAVIFSIGFPPGARDRLPVLLLSGALALLAAWNRRTGLVAFSFVMPFASLGDRLVGGVDALAWPLLLFLALASGWTFRFLYDFESRPDPSRADGVMRLMLGLWTLSAGLAIVRARTLWAILRGLSLRVVNVQGTMDTAAIRATLLSLAALAAGAGFFFLLRRAGRSAREDALFAVLLGTALSSVIAVVQRLGLLATETRRFWQFAGRFSGGAVDPNALGILAGALLPVAVAIAAAGTGGRRVGAAATLPALAAGLLLSGSRSGVGLVVVGLAASSLARVIPAGRRAGVVAGAALLVAIAVLARGGGSSGNVGSRLAELFNERVPAEQRASARPLLWRSAMRLFEAHPLEGTGLGAFAWRLPNLLAEEGRSAKIMDNPGNAWLQALAETGAIGGALTLAFVAVLVREAVRALRDRTGSPPAAGAGASLLGLLAALATGSHWFAPDVALVFFLMAAASAGAAPEAAAVRWPVRVGLGALALYAVAAAWATRPTLDPAEAFRYSRDIGFHGVEDGSGGPFRWTARRFAVRLSPGERLRVRLVHRTPEHQPVVLTAESESSRVVRTLSPGESVSLALSAPARAPEDVVFRLSRSFVPRRVGGSDDSRELGVVAFFATPE